MTDILSQARQLIQADQLQEAFDLLTQTTQQQPDFAEAHALIGEILENDKQYSSAFNSYLRAVKINAVPEWRFALTRCAALSAADEDVMLNTLRLYSQLFILHPEFESQLVYRNTLMDKLGLYVFSRYDEENATLRLVNYTDEVCSTIESYYEYFNRVRENPDHSTLPEYQPLVILRHYNDFFYRYPHSEDRANGFANSAVLFQKLGLFELAKQCYLRALELNSDIAPLVKMQAGMFFNLLGEYDRGLPLVEARWEQDLPGFNDVPFTFPRWRGEDLRGKRVLIAGEQGLGDAIQFVRYAPMLQKQGIYVAVLTKPGLDSFMHDHLMRMGILPHSDLTDECCHNYDYFIPIMSLPYYFNTTIETIPFAEGYLTLATSYRQKWKEKIAPTEKLKIGFVFAGNKAHGRNAERSISLETFSTIFNVDAQFHCLQKEIDDEDLALLQTFPNVTLHHQELDDFRDTAGLIEQMDLTISVDTSVAHLAAALGKKTWILVTYVPDFRWLLFRNDSPWYKQVFLFRQNIDFSWNPVLESVQKELTLLVADRASA